MSLTLITAMTTLRVLVGVASAGYSVYANRISDDGKVDPATVGTFNYGEIPKAIFGQVVGGIVYDFLKGGTADGYEQYLQRINNISADKLNHDLQRAARKATLTATYLACQGCLAESKSGFWQRLKNLAWKDADTASLIAVSKNLKEELGNLETATFDEKVDYIELFNIFDKDNIAYSKEAQEELSSKLRAETLKEIQNTSYYKLFGQQNVYLMDNAYALLTDAINNGWKHYPEDESPIVELKLSADGNRVKEYDWFQLVCVIFNEEYKVNEKIEAAMQKQIGLEQTSLLTDIKDRLQAFGQIENYKGLKNQIADFQEENYWLHTATRRIVIEKANETRDAIKNAKEEIIREFHNEKDETAPRIVSISVNLTVNVYGRDIEKDALLQALKGMTEEAVKHAFALIVAPSAFGKTYLLTKALQDVTDGETIKPEYSGGVKHILMIDCRQTQSLLQIVSEFNSLYGSQINFDENADINQWLNSNLFPLTHQAGGTTWLILDNFEAWLDTENYNIISKPLRAFLLALFTGNHRMRGVFLSQSDPERDIKRNLNKLETVGETLYRGLPEADALRYLRTEGAAVGLDKADESLLKEFLQRTAHIPQAMTSLVSYLSDIPDYTFAEFMTDNSFWDEFDRDERDATALDKGIRRTKALIARQINAQSSEVKLLLKALAFFNAPTAREALELLFENKAQAANPISRLHSHNLAAVNQDLRGTLFYELHSYFIEQARIVLAPVENIAVSDYAVKITERGIDFYDINHFAKSIALSESAEKIFIYVFNQENENAENNIAVAYTNKGIALNSLGRFDEAIVEYDKSIKIRERLVKAENRQALANDLAMIYINKGVTLMNLSRLDEAIVEYDKSIEIYERLVKAENHQALANKLAKTYGNKAIALENSNRYSESIKFYDLAESLWKNSIDNGEDHLLADYFRLFPNRIEVLIKLKDYQRTADDISNAFQFISLLEEPDFSDHFKQRIRDEIADILSQIIKLPIEQREEIYKHAGESDEIIRQYVEDFEKSGK